MPLHQNIITPRCKIMLCCYKQTSELITLLLCWCMSESTLAHFWSVSCCVLQNISNPLWTLAVWNSSISCFLDIFSIDMVTSPCVKGRGGGDTSGWVASFLLRIQNSILHCWVFQWASSRCTGVSCILSWLPLQWVPFGWSCVRNNLSIFCLIHSLVFNAYASTLCSFQYAYRKLLCLIAYDITPQLTN